MGIFYLLACLSFCEAMFSEDHISIFIRPRWTDSCTDISMDSLLCFCKQKRQCSNREMLYVIEQNSVPTVDLIISLSNTQFTVAQDAPSPISVLVNFNEKHLMPEETD